MPMNAIAAGAAEGLTWAHSPVTAPPVVRRVWDVLPFAEARRAATNAARMGARTPARMALTTTTVRHALSAVTPGAMRQGVGVLQTPMVAVGMALFDAAFSCPPDAAYDPVSPPCDPAWDRAVSRAGLRPVTAWVLAACEAYVMTLAVCALAGAAVGAVRGARDPQQVRAIAPA